MIDPTTQGILTQIDGKMGLTSNSFHRCIGERGYFATVVELTEKIRIATSTDGVGSKIDHLIRHMMYDVIGKDCVAMNINDLFTPLILRGYTCFYLDVSERNYVYLLLYSRVFLVLQ